LKRQKQTGNDNGAASRPRLDAIDKRLIEAIQLDGRRPYSRLAGELGISESAVRYRVDRLQQAKILQIVGIADPLKIGFDTMVLVGVRVRPGTLLDVCREVATLPEVSYVAATTGSFDVFVEVICRDTAHFTQFLTEHLHQVEGLLSAESFMILQVHKLAYGWGVGDGARPDRSREDGDGSPARHAKDEVKRVSEEGT
jgi:Lrp/AsnC family transcriptional regulator, regulator for asnA, asnC and gidA